MRTKFKIPKHRTVENTKFSDAGRKALASGEKIDLEYLEKSDEFKAFHSVTTEGIADEPSVEKEESPMEVLASAYQKVNAALASQLMDEVMKLTPVEFERLVVKLLLKMGYGSGIEEAGMVTQCDSQSGDGSLID